MYFIWYYRYTLYDLHSGTIGDIVVLSVSNHDEEVAENNLFVLGAVSFPAHTVTLSSATFILTECEAGVFETRFR